jgi:phage shock protein B
MDPVLVPIIIVFIVIGLPVIGGILLAFAKIMKGDGSNRTGDGEEARMIQDIHRGLAKLESRIDALETIILDREARADEHKRPTSR